MNGFLIPPTRFAPRGVGRRTLVALILTLTANLLWMDSIAAADDPVEQQAAKPAKQQVYQRAVLIQFEGEIDRLSENRFFGRLNQAKKQGADLVIVEFNSPGGLVDSSENLARGLADVDWAHVVAYVPRMALSGAAMASLGCDEIVMGSNARLGDVGVVSLGLHGFEYAEEKASSDVIRIMRDLAEARGRPPALAEAMVDKDLQVFHVTHTKTGEKTFMTDDEIQASEDPEVWEKGQLVLESREARFLEVNGVRAVELGLAEAIAESRGDLQDRYGWEGELLVLKPNAVDTALRYLNSFWIMALLIIIGLIGLFIEMASPGIGVGGLLAGLCFALFFWSHFLGGTAGWLEVIMFVAGVVFILMEIFVIPGFGVAGVTGLLLIVASLVLACQDFIIPNSSQQFATFGQSLGMVVGSGVGVVLFAIGFTYFYGSVPFLDRMALAPPTNEEVKSDPKTVLTSTNEACQLQVGDWGVAESPLRPSGRAVFDDQYVDVVSDGSFVDQGAQIRVVSMTGNHIVVRQIEESDSA